MKVIRITAERFALEAETADDRDMVDAIYFHRRVDVEQCRLSDPDSSGARHVIGAALRIDACSPQALRAQAGQQALSALGQLFRLGIAEATRDGHVRADATDPHAQEALAAVVEQLDLVLKPLRSQVAQGQAERGVVSHGASSDVRDMVPGAVA